MSAIEFKPGVYQHFKGGIYRALFIAKNSANGEPWVVYTCLVVRPEGHPAQPGQICTRPLTEWNDTMTVWSFATESPQPVPRFKFLHD